MRHRTTGRARGVSVAGVDADRSTQTLADPRRARGRYAPRAFLDPVAEFLAPVAKRRGSLTTRKHRVALARSRSADWAYHVGGWRIGMASGVAALDSHGICSWTPRAICSRPEGDNAAAAALTASDSWSRLVRAVPRIWAHTEQYFR